MNLETRDLTWWTNVGDVRTGRNPSTVDVWVAIWEDE